MIKLDLDGNKKDIKRKLKRIHLLIDILELKLYKRRVFETNKGFHVEAMIRRNIARSVHLLDIEIIAIQSILGSDSFREAYNFIRVRNKEVNWNILFEEKYCFHKAKLKLIHQRKRRKDLEVYL